MSTIPYAAGRRGLGLGVKITAVAAAALLGLVGVDKLTGWSPVHISAPHIHIPPVSQTVQGPSQSTLILQHLQAVGEIHAEDATYGWSKTTTSSHKFLGVTTGTAKHTVSLMVKVPIAVNVEHVAFSIPADKELVLYLPPPTVGTPSIDPASQQQVDSCARRVPLAPFFGVNLSRSCPGDTLANQEQAIADVTKQAAADTGTIDAARGQVSSLVACLVSPTGWQVETAWTDQPEPATFTSAACSTPPAQRLSPITTPTTGAP